METEVELRLRVNAPPVFTSAAGFAVDENERSVGEVRATDADPGDTYLRFRISGGADEDLFEIDDESGVLSFKLAPNYEDPKDSGSNNTYVVEVEARSAQDLMRLITNRTRQTITVTVNDVEEAPGQPGAPAVASASATSLSVNWSAPSNAGPAITDYDVQYRAGNSGGWSDGGHIGTATTATLTGLSENTSYDVQVRATNDEGTGTWSDAGSGTTAANAAPSCRSSATFSVAENETAVVTVLATDADTGDEVTGYAITGGVDQAFFSIGATSGALTFKAAPNYEDAKDIVSFDPANAAADNQYVVVVTATSGAGEREKTAQQTITVTVTDVDTEAPGKPAKPMVSAASATSLRVTWSAPSNAGPAITDYDYRYRTTSPEGAWTEVTGTTITGLWATLTGLAETTSYDVQVRAKNDEGTGAWSEAGSGATDANAAPSFSSSATISVAENQTTVVTVLATDSDTDDDITGYEITGGADQGFFSIGATSGALTFDAAPNYEDAQDQGNNNTYVVTVQATSGMAARVKTATQTITVTVTDVDEGQSGTVTIDDTSPMVGDELTASTANVADPDGLPDPFAPGWQWYRTPDGSSETAIPGAASATYTVVEADLGAMLTAKASWTDKGSFANTLSSVPTSAVAAASALPTLSIGDAEDAEDAGVEFTATLTAGVSGKVTATWTATIESGDTASAADLATTKTGDVEFVENATSAKFTVPVNDDTIDEDNETFTVTLSGVSDNAQLATDPTAKGTIVDDDTAPTVTGVEVTSEPVLETDTYGAGEEILFTVTFSETVTVTGDPEFAFSLDSGEDRAPYKSGSGTTALVFAYTVAPGDEDDNGIFLLDGSDFNNRVGPVTLDSDDAIKSTGSTTDADLAHTGRGTQSGHKVDGSRSIVSVEVTSTPQLESDTYGAGETIQFTVTFNVAVDVEGDPEYQFSLTGLRDADYESGSGTKALVFAYTVVSTDEDTNDIFLWDESDFDNPDGPVRLYSNDEITFKGTNTDVPLYWQGRGGGVGPQGGRLADDDDGQQPAVLHLVADVRRGGEPDGGGHGAGGGQRYGRQRHRLRDHRRCGPDVLLHWGNLRDADLRRGPQLRGRRGPGHEQHLRGGSDGDQRHRDAGDDRGPDHHGDGDRRGHRGAGQAGQADGVGGVGDQPDGELVGADQRGSADHGLRLPLRADRVGHMDRGDRHDDHGHHGDDRGPDRGNLLPSAGAGQERRGHRRLVGLAQRHDGRGYAARRLFRRHHHHLRGGRGRLGPGHVRNRK